MENPCFLVEDPNSSWFFKIMHRNNAANASPTGVHNQTVPNNENKNNANIDYRLSNDGFVCRLPTVSTADDGRYAEKREISIIYEPRGVAPTPASKATPPPATANETKLKKEWCPSGWRLELADHKHAPTGRKVATVFCALALSTVITLLATAAVVYILRTVHTSSVNSTKRSTWFGVVMVNGEFRITNEVFRNTLSNHETLDFQHLSSKISSELDNLFGKSVLSEDYHSSVVTALEPGLKVHCWLALRPSSQFMPGRVGMAFLGGLHHQHGNAWLGNYTVDIQSIGFESKVEEIAWSNWSDWSECKVLPGGRRVQVRTRNCVLQSGLHLSRADPCYLLDNHPSVDTIDCLPPVDHNTTPPIEQTPTTETRVYNKPHTDAVKSTDKQRANPLTSTTLSALLRDNKYTRENSIPKVTTEEPLPASQNYSTYEKRQCGLCVGGEVCVAVRDDPVPYCRSIVDYNDPTGCGGHCKINVELCQRLQKDIYRCVDDSQCLEDEWQCSNRLCIPISKRCDGYFNCYDNTDEFDCDCNLKTHFHCGNLLSCLPNSKKCNGIVDCWDASDEFNCTKDCLSSGQFTCNDSQCIASNQFCDGFPDCLDQSDEPKGCGGECNNNEWKCGNNRCIPKSDICNGFDNCGDNSDETSCGNVS
ncbi:sortilin-related receptor [Nilaparvata lugens]|uniref:sortilin-related receptor n=1 Tax=Nilaparvata lugens TaxID=108931 RepID=UPI00193DD6C6|nr:sortilin-related receptor [Nilaparvata lugens]XP_039297040.1 sortilin-related receptor [Nilaparvata lugens]